MDDRHLSSVLRDWLHETDAPLPSAAANVRLATERAGRTRQWGWAPRPRGAGRRTRRRSGRQPLRASLASITVAVLVTALAYGLLSGSVLDGEAPQAMGTSTDEGLHLQTDLIDLRADALRIEMADAIYTTVDAPLRVAEATSEEGRPLLRLDWTEQGRELRLEIVVGMTMDSASGSSDEWFVDTIRLQERDPEGPWASYVGPLFKTPFGTSYENDVELELFGLDEEIMLEFDGLVLTVEPVPDPPWWHGAHVLGIPIPDFIGQLLPSDWAPRERPVPAPNAAPWPDVVVPFAGVDLEGVLRPDSTVRVDRYKGRNTKNLVDVAVGPDDSVWVARPTSVYRVGGSSVINTKTKGLDEIRWIEPNDDGSLNVHGQGVWRLEGETWTRLSDDVLAKPTVEVPESLPVTRPDFIYGGTTSDGTSWGRTDAEASRLLVLPASEPIMLPQPLDQIAGTGEITTFEAAGLELQGEDLGQGVIRVVGDGTDFELSDLRGLVATPEGAIWVADRTRVHRLGQDRVAEPDGPEWIEGLHAVDDRIRVTGDGEWLLEDGQWRDLSASIRGRAMDDRDVVVLNDGTVVGLTMDDVGRWNVALLEDGAWVPQPVFGDVRLGPHADHLWIQQWTDDGAPLSDWVSLVDGGWEPLDFGMPAGNDPADMPIRYSFTTSDGSLWVPLGGDRDGAERIARFTDDGWSDYSLDALEQAAGTRLHLEPQPARDGRSIFIEPASVATGPSMVLFDGESIVSVPRLPPDYFVRAVGSDGSVWAIGQGGDLWVMPQAATVTKLETKAS